MKWLDFLNSHKANAEAQAKGKAELKPRHIRRLRKLWESKYIDKSDGKLNALFEVQYAERCQAMYQAESPFLKLIRKSYTFTGKPVCTQVNSYTEKIL